MSKWCVYWKYHKFRVSEDEHGLYEDDHGKDFCVYFMKVRKPGKGFEQRTHDLTHILGERQKQEGKIRSYYCNPQRMLLPSTVVVEVVGYSHILNVFSKQSKDMLMDGVSTVRETEMTAHFLPNL